MTCKTCKNFALACKGHYRVDMIDWVSPCRGCLQKVIGDDYDIISLDHIHYEPNQ